MSDECLVCKAPIKYEKAEKPMTCMLCGKSKGSKTCCVNNHFVCDECHTAGLNQFFAICINEDSDNPFDIFTKLTELPSCHMHGPEHHILVGASLLTAYKNAGGNIDLQASLAEMNIRGRKVPGGVCGFWGACGAAISAGQYMSIITKSTPLETDSWGISNLMTSRALNAIGAVGGPRCCKRDSRLAIIEAVKYTAKVQNVHMKLPEAYTCDRKSDNKQCIGSRCPFF